MIANNNHILLERIFTKQNARFSVKKPYVLIHVASLWHLPMNASHSSISVVELERNRGKKQE